MDLSLNAAANNDVALRALLMGMNGGNAANIIGAANAGNPIHPSLTHSLQHNSTNNNNTTWPLQQQATAIGQQKEPQPQPQSKDPAQPGGQVTLPTILHTLLADPNVSSVLSWLPDGKVWAVHDIKAFESVILPLFLKGLVVPPTVDAFLETIGDWGFQLVAVDRNMVAFFSEFFVQTNPVLSLMMKNRKDAAPTHQNNQAAEVLRLLHGEQMPNIPATAVGPNQALAGIAGFAQQQQSQQQLLADQIKALEEQVRQEQLQAAAAKTLPPEIALLAQNQQVLDQLAMAKLLEEQKAGEALRNALNLSNGAAAAAGGGGLSQDAAVKLLQAGVATPEVLAAIQANAQRETAAAELGQHEAIAAAKLFAAQAAAGTQAALPPPVPSLAPAAANESRAQPPATARPEQLDQEALIKQLLQSGQSNVVEALVGERSELEKVLQAHAALSKVPSGPGVVDQQQQQTAQQAGNPQLDQATLANLVQAHAAATAAAQQQQQATSVLNTAQQQQQQQQATVSAAAAIEQTLKEKVEVQENVDKAAKNLPNNKALDVPKALSEQQNKDAKAEGAAAHHGAVSDLLRAHAMTQKAVEGVAEPSTKDGQTPEATAPIPKSPQTATKNTAKGIVGDNSEQPPGENTTDASEPAAAAAGGAAQTPDTSTGGGSGLDHLQLLASACQQEGRVLLLPDPRAKSKTPPKKRMGRKKWLPPLGPPRKGAAANDKSKSSSMDESE